MGTFVFSFGCRAPVFGADLLEQQLRLAKQYYNALIDVERGRRAAYQQRCTEQSDELRDNAYAIEACVGVKADARNEAGEQRVQARSRRGASNAVRNTVTRADEDLKALWEERRFLIEEAKENDSQFKADLAAIDRNSKLAIKRLRHHYGPKGLGLFWGTYLQVEQAAEQARKSHRPPKFRKGDGLEGLIAVQLQKGLPVEGLFGTDTRIQIDPIPPDAYTEGRSHRRRSARTKVRLRVGTTPPRAKGAPKGSGSRPIFIELPVVLHRPIPPVARVKWATLSVYREACTFNYKLNLTVDVPEIVKKPLHQNSAVGIDLGWRWQSAIRVAYTYDTRGVHGPVHLPDDIVSAMGHADGLRATRDTNFNKAKADLADWLKAHTAKVPRWLLDETETISQWRNINRLAGLLAGHRDHLGVFHPGWRDRRFPGDDGIYTALEMWRKQDKHLWLCEHNTRRKALVRRKEQYRMWAAEIAETYAIVCIEDFDLRNSAKKPALEELGEFDDLARAQRIVSAPSLLRDALINACRSRGTHLIKVPCQATTITCHACGDVTRWDKAKYLSHACKCGTFWDQDFNAAVNILRAGKAKAKLKLVERVTQAAPRLGRWAQRRLKAGKRVA